MVEFAFPCHGITPAHADLTPSLACPPKVHPCAVVPELEWEGLFLVFCVDGMNHQEALTCGETVGHISS